MSKSEIIDEIKEIARDGDELNEIYIMTERLRVVAEVVIGYVDKTLQSGQPYIVLWSMLGLIGEISEKIEKEVNELTSQIIDIANTAVTD